MSNPYHDEQGRFASGESAASKGTEVKFAGKVSSAAKVTSMHVLEDKGQLVRVAVNQGGSRTSPVYRKSELKITVSGRKHNLSGPLGSREFAARLPHNPSTGALNALAAKRSAGI